MLYMIRVEFSEYKFTLTFKMGKRQSKKLLKNAKFIYTLSKRFFSYGLCYFQAIRLTNYSSLLLSFALYYLLASKKLIGLD